MLRGNFRELPFPDVIQLLLASGQIGALIITRSKSFGTLYFSSGVLLHATWGEEQGLDAIKRICTALDGNFSFEESIESPGHSLAKINAQKLQENIRSRVEMLLKMEASIPEHDSVPVFRKGANAEHFEATPDELRILVLANGERTVAEIAVLLNTSLKEVRKTFGRFTYHGLLDYVEAQKEKEKATGVDSLEAPEALEKTKEEQPKVRYWRGKPIEND